MAANPNSGAGSKAASRDWSLGGFAANAAKQPSIYERKPSNLIAEARKAYDAGLFIACLTVLVTIPDVCASIVGPLSGAQGPSLDQRVWCVRYLGLPETPGSSPREKNLDKTGEETAAALDGLLSAGAFTSSDFSQLRNAVLHAGSSVIVGKGEKYSPYHTVGVSVANRDDQLIIRVGSGSRPANGALETGCRYGLEISLTALLKRMERAVDRFLAEFPLLDAEQGKDVSMEYGIRDLR